MLSYSKKSINIISWCITIVILIILIILLDVYVFKIYENTYLLNNNVSNVGLNSNYIKEYSYIKRKSLTNKIVNIDNLYLEIMQMGYTIDNKQKNNEEQQKLLDNKNEKNIWRIKIPKINLDAPIETGTTQDVLAKAVGHFEQSPKWNGNVALAGHNRGIECNFFQNIKYLKVGDKIIYTTKKGKREYKVIMNKIIKQTNWEYIENTKDNRITLITCVENMYEYRRCIQAVEI